MSVNKVILIGNLGSDPEIRHNTQSGHKIAKFRIATSETWMDKSSGEKQERTEWHTIVIFNENLAKVAENYLKKGSKVYLEGQLQTRQWEDQSGNKRYSTEIVLQRFRGALRILGSSKESQHNNKADFEADDYRAAKQGLVREKYDYAAPPPPDDDNNVPF